MVCRAHHRAHHSCAQHANVLSGSFTFGRLCGNRVKQRSMSRLVWALPCSSCGSTAAAGAVAVSAAAAVLRLDAHAYSRCLAGSGLSTAPATGFDWRNLGRLSAWDAGMTTAPLAASSTSERRETSLKGLSPSTVQDATNLQLERRVVCA